MVLIWMASDARLCAKSRQIGSRVTRVEWSCTTPRRFWDTFQVQMVDRMDGGSEVDASHTLDLPGMGLKEVRCWDLDEITAQSLKQVTRMALQRRIHALADISSADDWHHMWRKLMGCQPDISLLGMGLCW